MDVEQWIGFKVDPPSRVTSVEVIDLPAWLRKRPDDLAFLGIDIPIGWTVSASKLRWWLPPNYLAPPLIWDCNSSSTSLGNFGILGIDEFLKIPSSSSSGKSPGCRNGVLGGNAQRFGS
jgi:hypothetical protein